MNIKRNAIAFLNEANSLFISRWKTVVGAGAFAAVSLTVYGLNILVRNVPPNPIWLLWWAFSGSYCAALWEVAYRRFLSHKQKELENALANPSGYTWTIYTSDGTKIGDIAESDYLQAKHEADLCWSTKLSQGLNYLWVAWVITTRLFVALPSVLVIMLLALSLSTPHEQLASITLGQTLAVISERWDLILNFMIVLALFILILFPATGKPAPGYKNFYDLRLKRLLAHHVPNIANADGYTVDGWKICLPNEESKTA